MLQDNLFSHIDAHYELELPFVVYKKPNSTSIKAVLQNNCNTHFVSDFTESGFVFAPFDSRQNTIIFPLDNCETLSSEIAKSVAIEGKENVEVVHKISRQSHLELVQKGIDYIKDEKLQKVVLSRVECVPISEKKPIYIFESLMHKYPSAFVYFWYHPSIGLWLGATPETLLDVEGRRFKTMALAGTQPFVDTVEVDWDSKNIDEQQVVTDYIEKELAPYTEQLVSTCAQTIKAGPLLHLQSKISGHLKNERLKDVIFSLHPTPAVCGMPKKEAKTFILDSEHYNREFYTGFLGELNIKKSKTRNTNKRNVENNAYSVIKKTSQLFVNLRCMQIKNKEAHIYVGGGITIDSDPNLEWEETVNKAQTIRSVF